MRPLGRRRRCGHRYFRGPAHLGQRPVLAAAPHAARHSGLADRGYRLLAEPEVQLAQLSAVCVPDGVDGKNVQVRLLREHNIEVGGGLGPDAPDIWRIGMMGTNAHTETADRLLEAFDAVLTAPRAGVSAGRG